MICYFASRYKAETLYGLVPSSLVSILKSSFSPKPKEMSSTSHRMEFLKINVVKFQTHS